MSSSSSSDAHKHCLSGSIHSGEPKGRFEEDIAGFRTYVATPSVLARKDKAIVYLADLFGLDLPNPKLLSDAYAEESGLTVYAPDFMEGNPVPTDAFTVGGFDLQGWFASHSHEKVYGFCTEFIAGLKEKYKLTGVAVVSFCWSGWFAVELASRPDIIDGAAIAHPSRVKVPEQIETICKPTLWICAEKDHDLTTVKRKTAQEVLEKNGVPNKFVDFPGTMHGFAVRGSDSDKESREKAKDEVVKFFRELYHL
eukprot:TRINITY_DN309_c0_g1_i3.p1 TRINITY_DN309_c0_g1~~TRINITY_DN309_c0_g1_i3.p1  ORF type:complete len:253 (-),score=46.48 TRINITY_DN309_c0_g1_i3:551-1309(-)